MGVKTLELLPNYSFDTGFRIPSHSFIICGQNMAALTANQPQIDTSDLR